MARQTKDQLLSHLRRRILTLQLAPGEPLDEMKMSADLNISRTPLRDIFRQLEGEGYLLMRENRGAFVSPMDHESMRHFFMTAPMIYASVSRLAARNAEKDQIDHLAAIQQKFRTAMMDNSVDGMTYFNDRFHFHIGVMAGNPYLMPSLQRLLIDHARIGQAFWKDTGPEQHQQINTACAHHDRFIEIIAAGDEEAAVDLTLEHWALSKDHMDLYIMPEALPADMIESA